MAAALIGISATSTSAVYAGGDHDDDDNYGDSSGTNTEQKPVQKNVGSGFSTNINCAQNLISSVGAVCFDPTVNATDDG